MDMKRRIIALILIVAMTATFAACEAANGETGLDIGNILSGGNQAEDQDGEGGSADYDAEGEDGYDEDYVEEVEPVKSLDELATSNALLDGVMLREQMTYTCIEELAQMTTFTVEDFMNYDFMNKNYMDFEGTEQVSLTSYDQIEAAFEQADDACNYNGGIYHVITIAEDMTLDGNLITNESGYWTNPKTTLSYGLVVVPSGVTLTLTNDLVLNLADMASGYAFLVVQSGGSVVLQGGSILAYKGIYIEEGGSLTLEQGMVETANLVNNGEILISASDEEVLTTLSVSDKFFNGASGVITVTNSGKWSLCAPSGGIYSVPYSSEDYGDETRYDYAMGFNTAFAWNYGSITVSEGGHLRGHSVDIGSEGVPFVNAGEMVLIAKEDEAADFGDIHFQNYGTLSLQGANNENTGRGGVLYATSSFLENYGTILFDQEAGYGIWLYDASNEEGDSKGYLINYAGATMQESNPSLQSLYLESYARFYQDVVPTNQMAVQDPAFAEMMSRDNWEGTYSTSQQSPTYQEKYVSIGYSSGDEMSFYFSYGDGDDRFNCYAKFLLTKVSDYSVSMKASSYDYPGEYPVTVTISEDYQSLTYTVEDTPYGTLTATVPRNE